jgi:hypothetical protein
MVGEQRFNGMSSLATQMQSRASNREDADALTRKLASAGFAAESITDDVYTIVPPPTSHVALLFETEEAILHVVRRLVKLGVSIETETS